MLPLECLLCEFSGYRNQSASKTEGSYPQGGRGLLRRLFSEPFKLIMKSPGHTLKVKVLVTQSCLALWDPMDCSRPGYSVHGILQARVLEWISTSFSRDLPDPGDKPRSSVLQADSLLSEPPGKPIVSSTVGNQRS